MHMMTDSLSKTAMWFGVVLLVVGVLGFVPGITTSDGLLLGIFGVDTLHNLVHIITGALGIWAAKSGMDASRNFFKVFGVVYGLVTILGFVTGNGLLWAIPTNMADNLLHVVIAALALYLGFGGGMKEGGNMMSMPSSGKPM